MITRKLVTLGSHVMTISWAITLAMCIAAGLFGAGYGDPA